MKLDRFVVLCIRRPAGWFQLWIMESGAYRFAYLREQSVRFWRKFKLRISYNKRDKVMAAAQLYEKSHLKGLQQGMASLI